MAGSENFGSLFEKQNFARILSYFRPFLDKTKDIVFLKSSKTLFCAIFNLLEEFCQYENFSQEIWLCYFWANMDL